MEKKHNNDTREERSRLDSIEAKVAARRALEQAAARRAARGASVPSRSAFSAEKSDTGIYVRLQDGRTVSETSVVSQSPHVAVDVAADGSVIGVEVIALGDKAMPPHIDTHPGALLLEEFLTPMGITPYRLAKETRMPQQRVREIIHGRSSITAETDLRLCRYFGLTPGYWMRAQVAYDLREVQRASGKKIAAEVKPLVA